ncbi:MULTISPECIES: Ohr family peroxiredoxin [unclassified Nonomuraea]|uniref:Ohr family peroxiredoxin n=1 Tax=unclassified Nonomuraea TaxID=2593643 RepID=UPI0035BFF4A2
MNNPTLSPEHDYSGSTFRPLYTTRVTVTAGASARADSADRGLTLELRMPEEMGDDNLGPDPEQLFAAGYAACFHGVLALLARRHLLDPETISVEAAVAFARDPADGDYELSADLVVTWPGVERETAAPLLAQASALCPYAKMTRRSVPATISFAA